MQYRHAFLFVSLAAAACEPTSTSAGGGGIITPEVELDGDSGDTSPITAITAAAGAPAPAPKPATPVTKPAAGAGGAGGAGGLAAGSGGAGGAGGVHPFPWGPFCRIGKSTSGATTSPEIWGCDDVVRTGSATNVPGLVVSIRWAGNLQTCSQSPYEPLHMTSDGNPPPCAFGSACSVWIGGGGSSQEYPGTCR